uniref:Ig-like domain-containing protein n=1 Tax=Sinocyclocheilus anshuiensis TaxID=1608454 RepID=A0A671L573_9TELE
EHKLSAVFKTYSKIHETFVFFHTGSHSLSLHSTYIKGKTLFPEYSYTFMLDDVVVGHFNSKTLTYVPKGNTTDEDDWAGNLTFFCYVHSGLQVHQKMVLCELLNNDKPGQMISRSASKGFTTDELCYLDGKFTYQGGSYFTQQELKLHLQLSMWRHENLYYPACIKTLKNYLKKRKKQVNRKVKPRLKFIQKANSDSGGFRVSCLATGFYPRHINLTLFRDGQPVADHEITGGDLLPNADGTYQMRKSMEISAADKHKYTCSVTHLSLDNKLDIELVLTVLALVLVFGTLVLVSGIIICKCRRRQAGSTRTEVNDKSSSDTFIYNTIFNGH